jgi:stress-induced-phosphoprotein 1
MAKSSKDYELAIEAFNKALTEHWNRKTLQKLNAQQSKQKKNLGSIMIQQ